MNKEISIEGSKFKRTDIHKKNSNPPPLRKIRPKKSLPSKKSFQHLSQKKSAAVFSIPPSLFSH